MDGVEFFQDFRSLRGVCGVYGMRCFSVSAVGVVRWLRNDFWKKKYGSKSANGSVFAAVQTETLSVEIVDTGTTRVKLLRQSDAAMGRLSGIVC